MVRSVVQQAREAPHSTKARILATAEEVFAARGFDGASTREIAARAGVNISSLHYHWDSKERLYFGVFQSVYRRIVELVQSVDDPPPSTPAAAVIETAMGRLFDFFDDNPNIPKLLLRRLLEDGETHVEIERDILVPAWRVFENASRRYRQRSASEPDSTLFMLSVHSVMLVLLLDSKEFRRLLGGSVRSGETRQRSRAHVIRLVQRLLAAE